jgi:hypothetical protein
MVTHREGDRPCPQTWQPSRLARKAADNTSEPAAAMDREGSPMESPRRQEASKQPRSAYRQCPGCDYDFLTGEGTKSCSWYDCPYLPEELKVFCPACNYNFATGEGVAWCGGDPPSCL